MFGDDALAVALAGTRHMNAADTITHLRTAVATHAQGLTSDDTALMLLRVI